MDRKSSLILAFIFFLIAVMVVLVESPRLAGVRAALEGGTRGITEPVGTSEPGVHSEPIGTSEPGIHSEPIGAPASGTPVEIILPTPENTAQPAETASPEQVSSDGTSACSWTTTFQDNFNGDTLDLTKWNPDYKAGDKEKQNYVEDAFHLKDGILEIKAEKRKVGGRDYASGIITTQERFKQQYGLFEVRAKVPHGQGLWPAFWMLPDKKNYPWEIDVFEILGNDTKTMYMTHHWKDDKGDHVWDTQKYEGPDFSQGFHTYALEWTPKELIWFVDGKERNRSSQGVPKEPMFMLLNLAVGGEWPGYPDKTTPFPSYLQVDYVRVWQGECK